MNIYYVCSMNYTNVLKLIVIFIVLGLLGYWLYTTYYKKTFTKASATKIQVQTILIKLWMECAMWMRMYITSAMYGVGNKDVLLRRLMINQENIGDSIGVFYGSISGKHLTELLKEHINIATNVVDAVLIGDQLLSDSQAILWKENANKICTFLSSINLNIDFQSMFYNYLELTTQEILAQYYRDWNTDIRAFDKIIEQVCNMAKELSDGITVQFNI